MVQQILRMLYNPHQQRIRAGWRLFIHLIATVFILIASYIALGVASYFVGLSPDGHLFFVLASIVQSGALVATVLLASWLLDRRRISSLGIDRRWATELSIGFAFGVVAMLVIFAIEWTMGWITINRVGTSATVTIGALVQSQIGWLLVMILVGISEEMLSRGYHLKNLSEGLRGLGSWRSVALAAISSSLFFGLLHAMNPNSSWISNLGVMLAGLMLALGRIATGSLAAPIGLHISWNLFQGPVLGFPVSGNVTENSVVALTQLGDPMWTGGLFGPEAGLMGVLATIVLMAIFLKWGQRKNRPAKHVASLTHFQDGRPAWRANLGAPVPIGSPQVASEPWIVSNSDHTDMRTRESS